LVVEDVDAKMRQLLRRIPKGKVTTYGVLAKKLGTSPRAVGIMLKHNDPRVAPCYKVVRADGTLGGYSGPGGVKEKIRMLKRDGVVIREGRVIRAEL
jgi:O-6-methylguanine DNA methyltransferase